MMKTKVLWIAFCFTLMCITIAKADTVNYAQLKQQVPEQLVMTVTTNSGRTVEVNASIILPDTNTLPVMVCKSQTFDLSNLYDVYLLEKGTPSYNTYYNADASADDTWLYCAKESKGYLLYGKTDYSTRSPLSADAVPAQNDFTTDDAMALIYKNIRMFGGDTSVDLRLNRAVAMSGLCRMKSQKITMGGSQFSGHCRR